MTAIIPACSAPAMSSASSAGVGSGGAETRPCHAEAPQTMPAPVTPSTPMTAAPGTPRAESATMAPKPSSASTGSAATRLPVVTSVASLAWMTPALRRAMMPRNRPMPAEMAIFIGPAPR